MQTPSRERGKSCRDAAVPFLVFGVSGQGRGDQGRPVRAQGRPVQVQDLQVRPDPGLGPPDRRDLGLAPRGLASGVRVSSFGTSSAVVCLEYPSVRRGR